MSVRCEGMSFLGDDVSVTTKDIGRDAFRGAAGLDGFEASLADCGGRGLLERPGVPDTVWLRESFCGWTLSEIVSSTGRGLRAWAMAKGPAWRGRNGAAMAPSTKLDKTVTGRTFSLIFSRRTASEAPKTMRWTLL